MCRVLGSSRDVLAHATLIELKGPKRLYVSVVLFQQFIPTHTPRSLRDLDQAAVHASILNSATDNSMSVLSQSDSPLFSNLPRELRDQIYEEYLEECKHSKASYSGGAYYHTMYGDRAVPLSIFKRVEKKPGWTQPHLLLSCKRIFAELALLAYSEFCIWVPDHDNPLSHDLIGYTSLGPALREKNMIANGAYGNLEGYRGRSRLRLVLEAPWDFQGMSGEWATWMEFLLLLTGGDDIRTPWRYDDDAAENRTFYEALRRETEEWEHVDLDQGEYLAPDALPVVNREIKSVVVEWAAQCAGKSRPPPFENMIWDFNWGSPQRIAPLDEDDAMGTLESLQSGSPWLAYMELNSAHVPKKVLKTFTNQCYPQGTLLRKTMVKQYWEEISKAEQRFLSWFSDLENLEVVEMRGNYPSWWGGALRKHFACEGKSVRILLR